jgi:hypothetical protein
VKTDHGSSNYILFTKRFVDPPHLSMGQRWVGSLPRGELGLDGHLLVRRGLSAIDWEGEFRGEKKRRKFFRYSFEYLKPHPELELFLSGTSRYGPYVKNNLRICRGQLHTVYLDVFFVRRVAM